VLASAVRNVARQDAQQCFDICESRSPCTCGRLR
jgi:hypothetical protein